jgi:hypothetical protein
VPKATETYKDSQGRRQVRTTGQDEAAVGQAATQAKAASTMGKKGNAGKTAMPKQSDYGSLTAYSNAMRVWREGQSGAVSQANALDKK